MIVEPDKYIIPDVKDEVIKNVFEFKSNQFSEIVNFGTHILSYDFNNVAKGDSCLAPVSLFRHSLDLMDSISQILKVGSSDTLKIFARALFETVLYLDYIFEKETENRSLNYLIHERYTTVAENNKYNPNTAKGKEYWKKIDSEGLLHSDMIKGFESSAIYQEVDDWLENGQYKHIQKEINRLKSKNKSTPQWYSLFNGPKSIYELAQKLKMLTFYEIYYRAWSNNVHSGGMHNRIFKHDNEGKVRMTQIRNPTDIDIITQITSTFGLRLLRVYITKRTPEKFDEFKAWYLNYRKEYLTIED